MKVKLLFRFPWNIKNGVEVEREFELPDSAEGSGLCKQLILQGYAPFVKDDGTRSGWRISGSLITNGALQDGMCYFVVPKSVDGREMKYIHQWNAFEKRFRGFEYGGEDLER